MALIPLIAALVCFIIYKYIVSIRDERRIKAFAEQNGCADAEDTSGGSLGGLKRLRRMKNMDKNGEDFIDDVLMDDFHNSWTCKFSAFDGTVLYNTVEPANVQAMLATQFKDFEVGKRRYDMFAPVIGRSVFSSDGEFWEHSRALFRPQFSRENINDLEVTDEASRAFITALGDVQSNGWTAGEEMMPLLHNFTLDTATDFLFGESVGSQQATIAARRGNDPGAHGMSDAAKTFADSFSMVNEKLVTRIRMQSLYWLGDGFEFRRAIRGMHEFTAPIVQRAINTAASSAKREEKKQSLLASLATQTQDRTELRNQTLAILLAGRDTTASMLGWALLRLSLHPEVFTKLRKIILEEFEPGEEITFSKLKGCRYLQHFLNEVLRLHPTVPLNQRVATKDTMLPIGGGADQRSPIAIRKGQIVLFSVYIMQRRKDLWGSDAEEFRPERFEQRIPAWQYLPFLGGPRICLGQQFALTEASYLIVKLLQEFDAVEPVNPAEARKLPKGLGVTMWPGEGAKVRFRKAAVA